VLQFRALASAQLRLRDDHVDLRFPGTPLQTNS
jgi:hypothetical protein